MTMTMTMSQAAIAPRQPHVSARDRQHPLFPTYQQHRSAMSRMLVEASSFRDWLSCYERETLRARAADHPQYHRFLDWMLANQGGARKCPSGIFPHNFWFWLEGGRW